MVPILKKTSCHGNQPERIIQLTMGQQTGIAGDLRAVESEIQTAVTIDPRGIHSYLAGIARKERMKTLSVGGTNNHVHVLLSLPATMPIAKAVQLLKCNSSGWINDLSPAHRDFGWQEGYGAFSVSGSAVVQVTEYIQRQEEHHRKRTFEEEYLALLKKHGPEHDLQRVFG